MPRYHRVTWEGKSSVLPDDFTLDELEAIENVTGVHYLALDPLRSAAIAKAVIAILMTRDGRSDEEARREAGGLTRAKIRAAFESLPDDYDDTPQEWADGLPDPKAEAAPSTD